MFQSFKGSMQKQAAMTIQSIEREKEIKGAQHMQQINLMEELYKTYYRPMDKHEVDLDNNPFNIKLKSIESTRNV